MANTIAGIARRMKTGPRSVTTRQPDLSPFRSLAIFLFKQQAKRKGAKASLPDFQSPNHSHPWALIRRFTDPQQE